jgi:hypothetical protein
MDPFHAKEIKVLERRCTKLEQELAKVHETLAALLESSKKKDLAMEENS